MTDDARQAKADAKVAKAKAKALRPWYKKKRFLGLIAIALIAVISVVSNEEPSLTTTSESDAANSSAEQSQIADQEPATEESDLVTEETASDGETVSQKNARRSAENYLGFQAFSRSGLIKQLEFEGFSTEDAAYGIDALDPDWNDQAAKSAKNYLEFQAFSRSGLIEQLLFEGFSKAEAEYGVSTAGL